MEEQLKHAVEQMQAARAVYQAAKGKRALQEAASDFEFWSSKAAMLDVMVQKFGKPA